MHMLFNNFFLDDSNSDTKHKVAASSYIVRLTNTDVETAVANAVRAYVELKTVCVKYDTPRDAEQFLDALFMRVGKVDYADVKEVRTMNDMIFFA